MIWLFTIHLYILTLNKSSLNLTFLHLTQSLRNMRETHLRCFISYYFTHHFLDSTLKRKIDQDQTREFQCQIGRASPLVLAKEIRKSRREFIEKFPSILDPHQLLTSNFTDHPSSIHQPLTYHGGEDAML